MEDFFMGGFRGTVANEGWNFPVEHSNPETEHC